MPSENSAYIEATFLRATLYCVFPWRAVALINGAVGFLREAINDETGHYQSHDLCAAKEMGTIEKLCTLS